MTFNYHLWKRQSSIFKQHRINDEDYILKFDLYLMQYLDFASIYFSTDHCR